MAHGPINTATTCAVAVPLGGFLSGDLLVAQVMVAFNDFFAGSTIITPQQAGWTTAAQDSVDATPFGTRLAVFYRFSTGVEPASYGFQWATVAGNVVRISTYRGVDTVTPVINTAVVKTGPSDSVTALTASVVTTRANTRIITTYAAAQALGVSTFTAVGDQRVHTQDDLGYAAQLGNSNPDYPNILLTGEIIQAGAGPSGVKSATIDMTGGSSRIVMAHAMGLNPKQF